MIVVRRLADGTETRLDAETLPDAITGRIKALFAWHVQHGGARPQRVILDAKDGVTLSPHASKADSGEDEAAVASDHVT